jgi:hypothetical protein
MRLFYNMAKKSYVEAESMSRVFAVVTRLIRVTSRGLADVYK